MDLKVSSVSSAEVRSEVIQNIIPVTNTSRRKNWQRWQSRVGFRYHKGDAIGSRSALLPILIIGIALFISGKISGTYGIAISTLGMLSFVGATVSIDAFGYVADNAGGLAGSPSSWNIKYVSSRTSWIQ